MAAVVNHLTNDELASIYDYLNGFITQAEMARELGKTRTNTYYYIGRAVDYWLRTGVLKFEKIEDTKELGGSDV